MIQTGLIIPDCHHPYVDVNAWNLMLDVASYIKPYWILILGDFGDAASLSDHGKNKPLRFDFEDELKSIREALDQLDALKAKEKIYIEGNHEHRLNRYLASNAPAVYRNISLPKELDLKNRGWEWVPYRTSRKIGKIHATHDTGTAGSNAHRQSAQKLMGSILIGHSHRMSYEVVGRLDNTPYIAGMFGWLGDREASIDYMSDAAAGQWVHGFGLGYRDTETDVVHITPVPIINYRCVVHGKLFKKGK